MNDIFMFVVVVLSLIGLCCVGLKIMDIIDKFIIKRNYEKWEVKRNLNRLREEEKKFYDRRKELEKKIRKFEDDICVNSDFQMDLKQLENRIKKIENKI